MRDNKVIEGKIGIVIVNYNGEKYQNDALKTIYQSSYQNFEVIIVDSGSKDNSIKLAQIEYPNVHYLLQKDNIGVARGNNIGIQYAINRLGVEYILLLNNDVELEKHTIQRLVDLAGAEYVVVPKIYFYKPDNILWFAGGAMRWNRGEAEHWGIFEKDNGCYNVQKEITFASACCMLLHIKVFERVGLFDENVFMYFDDTDFCARLNDEKIKILYCPSAVMWHKASSAGGGMDSKIQVYYMTRNKFYYMRKYKEKLQFPARIYTYGKFIVKFLISPIYKKNDRYIAKAWKDYLKGNMGRCDTL